jgi:hypothetical protein
MSSPSWYQFLTIAGALAVVNSILIGGILGLAVEAGAGALAGDGAGGVNTGAVVLAGHLARQRATWRAARQPASAPPPTGCQRPGRVLGNAL